MRNNNLLPVNLQFFAEEPDKKQPENQDKNQPKPDDNKGTPPDNGGNNSNEEYTIEGLLAQLTQQKADNARMKTEFDKVMTESGNHRKQLRAKQTAEEQEAEAKAEAEREQAGHMKSIEKELAIIKASNRYLKLGFGDEEAAKMATDEVEGNMDAWTAGVDNFIATIKKDAYAQARADLLKDMPQPQSGNEQSVDYNQKIQTAMESGNKQDAIKAMLEQAKANNG